MTNTSFTGWQLSSSGSEDEDRNSSSKIVKDRKVAKDLLDMSMEEPAYIPLAQRLKMRQGSNSSRCAGVKSDDDLPAFEIEKMNNLLSVPTTGRENKAHISKPIKDLKCGTRKSPGKRKKEVLKSVSDNSKQKKEEMAKRKAMTSHLKTLKPEECLKYMICSVSHLLIAMFDEVDFLKELQCEFDTTCRIEHFDIPCVRWQRKVTLTDGIEEAKTEIHDEPEMLVYLPASEFAKMVGASVSDSEEETLTTWMKKLCSENPLVNIHVVCHGIEKFRKDMKQRRKKESRKLDSHSRKNCSPNLSPDDMEEALVDLQIECNTTVLYVEKSSELITMIKQLTKSIGQAPYKRMKSQDVQFINEIPSVKINAKTGEGVTKVWKQMIQQFHNVTPVMAGAITDKYPTPLSLLQAYEECRDDKSKAEGLLANIPVRRGVGTIQTSRRIGPELSYKIFIMMTSLDPDEYLY